MVVPRGKSRVVNAENFAAGDLEVGSRGLIARGRVERDARDRSDRGQSFSAKSQSGDGEQIVCGAQLRGGVALKGQQRVVAVHAIAVIGDADQLAAAGFDFNADARGAGVERIFEQLFDHGGGAVNHFAGGDLVGHLVRENSNVPHKGLG